MSDLYVELRTRIPVVTQWVEIGTERLQQAQDATGLSDERLAREIPVSVKTWYRWKKRGAVPADSLDALARVLDIEVRRPGERPLQVAVPTPQDVAAELADLRTKVLEQNQEIAELRELAEEIRQLLVSPRARRATS